MIADWSTAATHLHVYQHDMTQLFGCDALLSS